MMQRGQILLLIVLVGAIALTVGLSILTQSITNVRSATEQEQSQKAIAAAEAGIQLALNGQTISSASPKSFSSGKAQIISAAQQTVQGSQLLINNGNLVSADVGTDVWLIPHDATSGNLITTTPWTGSLSVYWGQGTFNCTTNTNGVPALEVVLVYLGATVSTTHYVADPCNAQRGNNFSASAGSGIVSGQSFSFGIKNITVTNGYILRVIPLYTDAVIGIISNTGTVLPTQGTMITSVGASGDTQRKITYYQSYPVMPAEIFPYLFFVGSNQ